MPLAVIPRLRTRARDLPRDGSGPGPEPGPGRRAAADRGSVLVEFVGMFPYILLMMALIWQGILIGYTFSLAGNAADQGARAGAAAQGGAGACQDKALEDLPGAWQGSAAVTCADDGTVYTAEVVLTVPVLFPGVLSSPITIDGRAGAADEREGG
ncbi:TadE/TadG family type IV pilus assembly protein [Streptomyces aidingensis]|uniref:Pilus assembly protein CpaE n=1 Tax=Streptomyces aidingensis TaxID=910347 RepID=A0A1I1EU53_9ACTN|nr:TadE/TadG family type IV pilus assembly protein [Streptomyces aidingensis]SFB88433.1 pilus assembly protein CpaE [Streptomyces aidingensis]